MYRWTLCWTKVLTGKSPTVSLHFIDVQYFALPYFKDCSELCSQKISMWNVYNLLKGANKSSYIDSYLSRAVNATEVSVGLNNALHGDQTYQWFLG